MSDHYAALGVERTATAEEIKKAYRRKARTLHPDVNPSPEAAEEFKRVSVAYDVLGDEEKRRLYDRGVDPFSMDGGGFGAGAGFSFADIVDAMFGGGTVGGQRGPRPRTMRGQDALVRCQVDLRTAVFGGEQALRVDTAVLCETCEGRGTSPGTEIVQCSVCSGEGEIRRMQRSFLGNVMTSTPCSACHGYGTVIPSPCFNCDGDGRVRDRVTLNVRVPAGVDTGTRIRLDHLGEVGPGGGERADLYLEVQVAPHETFTRHGDDLHCTMSVPMTAAALGASLSLETFDGTQHVDVPAGTQSGQQVVLHDLGVTHLRREGRGDLVVHLEVRTPTKLSDEQADLLRRLAELRGEEAPVGRVGPAKEGLFGRLKDAFTGR